MIVESLSPRLKKPTLYERTAEPFWNDPHISQGMLAAHLDQDTDAASRRFQTIDRSVQWISGLLTPGSLILDLGCGPGLYTKRFAERGFRVTGLDLSERSIRFAKEQDTLSRYLVQDYLELNDENEFDLITLIWCDYGALIPEERERLLERVHRALKPGGLLILDVFTPMRNAGSSDETSWEIHESGGFWSPHPHIVLNAEYHYGGWIDVSRTVLVESAGIRCFNIWNTCFTPESLTFELQRHHLIPLDFYADTMGEPYAGHSELLCALVRKA